MIQQNNNNINITILAPIVSIRNEVRVFQFAKVQFSVQGLTDFPCEQVVKGLPIMWVPPPSLNYIVSFGTTVGEK